MCLGCSDAALCVVPPHSFPSSSHHQTGQKRIHANSPSPYFTKQTKLVVLLIFQMQKITSPTWGATLPFLHAGLHFRVSSIHLKINKTSPHCLSLFILLQPFFYPQQTTDIFRGKFGLQALSFNSCYNPAQGKTCGA